MVVTLEKGTPTEKHWESSQLTRTDITKEGHRCAIIAAIPHICREIVINKSGATIVTCSGMYSITAPQPPDHQLETLTEVPITELPRDDILTETER